MNRETIICDQEEIVDRPLNPQNITHALVTQNDDNKLILDVFESEDEVSQFLKKLKNRQKLLDSLITDEDKTIISGKTFPKKSAMCKIATVFNVSVELKNKSKEESFNIETGLPVIEYIYETTASFANGVHCDEVGSAKTDEPAMEAINKYRYKKSWQPKAGQNPLERVVIVAKDVLIDIHKAFNRTAHDTRAIAYTRAASRAISRLVLGGKVTSDEITDRSAYNNYNSTSNSKSKSTTYASKKSVPSQDSGFNPDEDVPDFGIQSKKIVANQINEILNKTYAKYINKEDFAHITDRLKDGKWKDISYDELFIILRSVENRCMDLKAAADQ